MAIAQVNFADKVSETGGVLYGIIVEDLCRYAGPPGTRWSLIDSSRYHFWSSADDEAHLIAEIRAGKVSMTRACKEDSRLATLVEWQVREWYGVKEGELQMSERKQRSLWLERFDVEALFGEPLSEGSYWTLDDDAMLGEAVEALEYPEWAGPERGCAGGPGTGYMAGYIRIEEGHGFDELWQWLGQRQAERDTGRKPVARKTTKRTR